MAYKPTVDDLQAGLSPAPTGGYQPTLSEFQEGITQPTSPSYAPPLFGAIKDIGTAGLGALQGIAQLGHGLGQLETGGVNKIAALLGHPTHLHAPEPNVFVGPLAHLQGTFPAEVGKLGAETVGTLLPGAELGKIGEALGAGRRLATGLGLGTVGALTTPGTAGQRAVAGLVAGTAPEVVPALGKIAKGLGKGGAAVAKSFDPKYWSATNLSKLITKTHGDQKVIARQLYNQAFKGTKNIKPFISPQTHNSLVDMIEGPAGSGDIKKSLLRFKDNTTVEGLHALRSDLGTSLDKLNTKELKSGLDSFDGDKQTSLRGARAGIDNDLERSMLKSSPDNYSKYQRAQEHWKENVVPFKAYPSLRKLLGPEHEITRSLYSDIAKKSVSADHLKNLMNLDPKSMAAARYLKASGKKAAIYGIPTILGFEAAHRFLGE